MLAEKVLTIFADDIVFLFEALKGNGQKHKIKEEYRSHFELDRERITSSSYVMSKVRLMFPLCNVDGLVLFAQNSQVCRLIINFELCSTQFSLRHIYSTDSERN